MARLLRSFSKNLHSLKGSTTPKAISVPSPTPVSRLSLTTSHFRAFSSSHDNHTPTTANMTVESLVQLAQNRRTFYQLGRNSPVPDSKIEELVEAAILNVPSSFNTQSTRIVVLLHAEHEKLWDIAADSFGGLVASGAVSEEMFKNQTQPKLQGFKKAYGTVRFPLLTYYIPNKYLIRVTSN